MVKHSVCLQPLDDDSINSIITLRTPISFEIMKAATTKSSKTVSNELKISKKLWVEDLNTYPPNDGIFMLIPYNVNSNLQDNIIVL